VARWKASADGPIEAPEWYRNFHPEAWDAMDDQEQAMFDGCPTWRPWPDYLHEIHAERRWHQAQHAYRQEHPAFATQEFNKIINGFRDGDPGY
jgi:hypothetical protein